MEKKSVREIIAVILKAVTLAMGVAVVVLSGLGSLQAQPCGANRAEHRNGAAGAKSGIRREP